MSMPTYFLHSTLTYDLDHPHPEGDIDLLAVGETLIDFISEVEIDRLGEAETFRRITLAVHPPILP